MALLDMPGRFGMRRWRWHRCREPIGKGFLRRGEVKNMAVVGVSLTYCGSGADEFGSGRFASHVTSLAGVAMVSESVSALSSVSTSPKQGEILAYGASVQPKQCGSSTTRRGELTFNRQPSVVYLRCSCSCSCSCDCIDSGCWACSRGQG